MRGCLTKRGVDLVLHEMKRTPARAITMKGQNYEVKMAALARPRLLNVCHFACLWVFLYFAVRRVCVCTLKACIVPDRILR